MPPISIDEFRNDPDYRKLPPQQQQEAITRAVKEGIVAYPKGTPTLQDFRSPLPGENPRQLGQRLAITDPTFEALADPAKAIASTALPIAGTALGAAVGGVPGAMALGAAGEYANQKLGLTEPSWLTIGLSGAAPAVPSALKSIGTGAMGITRPGLLREAGVEATAKRMGMPASSLNRVLSEPVSRQAFRTVEAVSPPVPTPGLVGALDSVLDKIKKFDVQNAPQGLANPPFRAVTALQNVRNKFASQPEVEYQDVARELRSMRARAESLLSRSSPDKDAAVEIYNARAQILDELDNISPALKEANAVHRKSEAQQVVIESLRRSDPGTRIRNIFETDRLISGVFSKDEIKDIYHLADKISAIGGASPAGEGARIVSNLATPIGEMLNNDFGRMVLRNMIGPGGKIAPTGIASAVQFWRAYQAQSGSQPQSMQKPTPQPESPPFLQRHFDRQSPDNL